MKCAHEWDCVGLDEYSGCIIQKDWCGKCGAVRTLTSRNGEKPNAAKESYRYPLDVVATQRVQQYVNLAVAVKALRDVETGRVTLHGRTLDYFLDEVDRALEALEENK